MSQIKLHGESSRTNYNPFTKKFQKYPWQNKLTIDDKLTIDCKNDIKFYVVLNDRIFILINHFKLEYYKRKEIKQRAEGHVGLKAHDHEYDKNNLFCYDKNTGQQLWQVQNIDDSPFTSIGLDIKEEEGKAVLDRIDYRDGKKIGVILEQPFRQGIDLFGGFTFNSIEYTIDIDTGEATFYKQGK